ncbi:twin-arginine translocation signal domain-containing protein [Streptomyces sp. NPDC056683]|uniref:twin-arginine translocation signal domain-containing protein n=1 Tax=Streptomyces sp. NPDC056683 TaxID=3345910 RepID=UPI003674E8CC
MGRRRTGGPTSSRRRFLAGAAAPVALAAVTGCEDGGAAQPAAEQSRHTVEPAVAASAAQHPSGRLTSS